MVPTIKSFVMIVVVLLAVLTSSWAESEQKLFEMGVDELKNGQFQTAVDLFTEMIKIAPGNPKAYKNRGVALMKLEAFDLAMEDFEKAYDIDPDLVGIHSNIGAAWHYKGEFQKAVESYNKEITQRPGEYITYFNRALSLIELKEYDRAMEDLDKTLEMKPDLPWAISLKKELEKKQVEKKQVEKKQVEKKEVEKREVEKREEGSPKRFYTVQTGAYLNPSIAQTMLETLKGKGYDAYILTLTTKSGKIWHLLRTGKYAEYADALKLCDLLKEKEKIDAIVAKVEEL